MAKNKTIKGQIVDFRELTKELKEETLNNYKNRLSKYDEIYTLTDEIKEAIENDKDFYILVFLINNKPVAHIQFKYFKSSKMIFIDYVYTLKNNISYTNNLYYFVEEKISKIFDVSIIVTEISFANKRRNKALEKLLSLQDFKALEFKYIQPPTESFLPSTGALLIKEYSKNYSVDLIVKDIYFNHYAYWYKDSRFYKVKIFCLYFLQKMLIKKLKKVFKKGEYGK